MSTVVPRANATVLVLMLGVLHQAATLRGEEPDSSSEAERLRFFENRIRPVLVEKCYGCHSAEADEASGSLRLDSADGMLAGGDSGAAVVPGDLGSSILISAIKYESSEMPPSGKLPNEVIEDFERWITDGALDPRINSHVPSNPRSQIDFERGRQFWAFRPIADAQVPTFVSNGSDSAFQRDRQTSRGTIDQFLFARLREAGLSSGKMATPQQRLRRLCFDLTGLPPSLELQERWIANPSRSHWIQIVDQLLASRSYGEHWARHWMDVARYADSNGSDFNATHHEAYRYRNYLIESFCADAPFDQMIRQQVAGDLIPVDPESATASQQRYNNLVATTFLMLGPKMLSERDKQKLTLDVVDEQIDTVGRAFMGLTLGCARCHDHKFDPIPTEDYYALAGIFKSTVTLNGESQKYVSTWNRQVLPTTKEHQAAIVDFERRLKELESNRASLTARIEQLRSAVDSSSRAIVVDDAEAIKMGNWTESTYIKHYIGKGYVHDNNTGKGKATIRYEARLPHDGRYRVRVSHSGGSSRADSVPVTLVSIAGSQTLKLNQRDIEEPPMWSTLGEFQFREDQPASVTISNEGTQGYVIADAIEFTPLEPPTDPESGPIAEKSRLQKQELASATRRLSELESEIKRLKSNQPASLPEAMAPTDRPSQEITDSPVHIRGEPANVGDIVRRGFLRVCGEGDARLGKVDGSGRLELALWLTDPDHPLVARVYVNRVWMHLMGEGIVRTVDNFGLQGDRPSHPALLDFLAGEFIRNGWQTKALVRQIVLSDSYAQSSEFDADKNQVDPENRLWWRMPRRRLPAESIRDSMLFTAGLLDQNPRDQPMAGRGVLVSKNNGDSKANFDAVSSPVRTVYLPVVRGYMPALLTAMDIADPDLLVGKRPTTNVPGQALMLVQSPEVDHWSRATAERIVAHSRETGAQIHFALQTCLQRPPTDDEMKLLRSWIEESDQGSRRETWHQIVASIFASTEFRLLD